MANTKNFELSPAPSLTTDAQHNRLPVLIFVWTATLLVSSLPAILAGELKISLPFPILWIRTALLAGLIALSFVWQIAQPLRRYFVLFLVLYLADGLFTWMGTTPLWQSLAGAGDPARELMSSQLLRLGVAFTMIFALWWLRYRRDTAFLGKGNLRAAAEPVNWLGMSRPVSWSRFGLILSLCITSGTLAFLLVSSRPDVTVLVWLPLIILMAGMNAFSEEVAFRAALLAPLYPVVGQSQALLLTAVLFGLWHFYGIPYGVVGVIMAGVLGWLLGKSMLETKGIFWAWFIHFWQDAAIFTFVIAGTIRPGG